MKSEVRSRAGAYLLALVIIVLLPQPLSAQSRTFITNGIFDGRELSASDHRIALNGNWDFYWQQFLQSTELSVQKRSSLLVPSLWNDHPHLQNTGFATYSLKLILPRDQRWALEVPQIYNSYSVFINGQLAGENGKPSSTRNNSGLEWRPQYIPFISSSDTTTVTLHLSNHHHYSGGIREPIYLAKAEVIKSHFLTALTGVMTEVGALTLLAVFFITVYGLGGKRRTALYFALFCLSWALREMFSDLYPISAIVSVNWFVLVRIEYLSFFLTMGFGLLFVSSLYPDLRSDVFNYLAMCIIVLLGVFCLFAPVITFTKWLPLYLVVATIVLGYSAGIVLRAMIHERSGAWFLTGGLLLSVLAFSYDLIAYKGIIDNHILFGSICHILNFICCGIGVLQQLRIVNSPENKGNVLRYQDLYR